MKWPQCLGLGRKGASLTITAWANRTAKFEALSTTPWLARIYGNTPGLQLQLPDDLRIILTLLYRFGILSFRNLDFVVQIP